MMVCASFLPGTLIISLSSRDRITEKPVVSSSLMTLSSMVLANAVQKLGMENRRSKLSRPTQTGGLMMLYLVKEK